MKDVFMKNNSKHLSYLALTLALVFCVGSVPAQADALDAVLPKEEEEQKPQDFSQRASLGEMKESALPSTSDNVIADPSPMPMSVSIQSPPSERLLGKITSEVFHEMAELERGNVFLKLQTQREQLKNDLEKLKASYRQARLDEIEKREGVIRTRVEWMQEQERVRQEILELKMKTEQAEKELEVAELRKAELLKATTTTVNDDGTVVTNPTLGTLVGLTILDIKGMKGNLTARLYGPDGKVFSLKIDQVLPSGHKVKAITKKTIVFTKDGVEETIEIAPLIVAVPVAEENASNDENLTEMPAEIIE